MKTKLFVTAAMLALLCACQAQMHAGTDASDMESGVGGRQAAPAPLKRDPANNPDMTQFAAEVDGNNDGRLSRGEWQAKGLPSSSFDMFEKGRGYVTLRDYQENAAPAGIDLNEYCRTFTPATFSAGRDESCRFSWALRIGSLA